MEICIHCAVTRFNIRQLQIKCVALGATFIEYFGERTRLSDCRSTRTRLAATTTCIRSEMVMYSACLSTDCDTFYLSFPARQWFLTLSTPVRGIHEEVAEVSHATA